MKGKSLLLVSPHDEDYESLRDILRNSASILHPARSVNEARQALVDIRPAAIIVDSDCWKELLRCLQEMRSPPALIVADRLADERLWAEVLNLGAYDLLNKPFDAKEVLHVLGHACRRPGVRSGHSVPTTAVAPVHAAV